MFLGVYRFKGQADELLAAYDRLMATMPMEDLELHVCTHNDQGIAIYDTCPSREEFDTFANGESLRDALAAAGIPPSGRANASAEGAHRAINPLQASIPKEVPCSWPMAKAKPGSSSG